MQDTQFAEAQKDIFSGRTFAPEDLGMRDAEGKGYIMEGAWGAWSSQSIHRHARSKLAASLLVRPQQRSMSRAKDPAHQKAQSKWQVLARKLAHEGIQERPGNLGPGMAVMGRGGTGKELVCARPQM